MLHGYCCRRFGYRRIEIEAAYEIVAGPKIQAGSLAQLFYIIEAASGDSILSFTVLAVYYRIMTSRVFVELTGHFVWCFILSLTWQFKAKFMILRF